MSLMNQNQILNKNPFYFENQLFFKPVPFITFLKQYWLSCFLVGVIVNYTEASLWSPHSSQVWSLLNFVVEIFEEENCIQRLLFNSCWQPLVACLSRMLCSPSAPSVFNRAATSCMRIWSQCRIVKSFSSFSVHSRLTAGTPEITYTPS